VINLNISYMKKIYFRELLDISDEFEKVNWIELKSRFTPGKPYQILEINYITQKKHKPSLKSYLVKNDFDIGEWVYSTSFLNHEEWRNNMINTILE